jgi:CHAT domain-containing protein
LTRGSFVESSRAPRFLHLATHAYYSLDSIARSLEPHHEGEVPPLAATLSSAERVRRMNPMTLCGLALSGANGEGGRFGRLAGVLTAEDIAGLDLGRCELAVLSACGTSQGELRPLGSGTASLQRAFQLAGARATVTSLWHVDDATTRELMRMFYTAVWREGVPPRDALWQAKMELDDRSVPPREWAAWVLTGLQRQQRLAPSSGAARK